MFLSFNYSVSCCTRRDEDGREFRTNTVTLGDARSVVVRTDVFNAGEDAFQATISIAAPTRLLEIGRSFGSLNSVSCAVYLALCIIQQLSM